MPFDFELHLAEIDPSQRYRIEGLTGGLVNETVRAVKLSPIHSISDHSGGDEGGIFPEWPTLILKYAPPYVAKIGPEAPFSEYRQVIEAQALALFSPSGRLNTLNDATTVSLPTLLGHDVQKHVLILSDLGSIPNLSASLASLRKIPLLEASSQLIASYQNLGIRLGHFFAELHSARTRERLGADVLASFENPGVGTLVYKTMISPLKAYLTDFGIPNTEELYRRIRENFDSKSEPGEECFALGDSWSGAILWDPEHLTPGGGGMGGMVGVIDWEFAGMANGLNGDMTQLFADLHMYLVTAPAGSALGPAARALMAET